MKSASDFIFAIARAAGDEEAEERRKDVFTTAEKIRNNEPATGQPTCVEIFGEKIWNKTCQWLNLDPSGDRDAGTDRELQRAAQLDPVSYDREREPLAERLGIRLTTLDLLVKKRRPRDDRDNNGTGQNIVFEPVEPSADEVDGAQIFDAIIEAVRFYLVLPQFAPEVIALWILYTYCASAFDVATWLALLSATPRCGKTRTLEVLGALANRTLSTSNISPSAFFRVVDANTNDSKSMTILIDEFDSFANNEDLRGVLNSGYRRGAGVLRTERNGDGKFEVKRYSTFAPLVFAKIGDLSGTLRTLRDRAVVIWMKRRLKSSDSEAVYRLRMRDFKPFVDEMKPQFARWSADHIDALKAAEPDIPKVLDDRAAEIVEPLLAIADEVGGDWPERARKALVALLGDRDSDDDSVSTMLLADIRDIFAEVEVDRYASKALAEKLADRADRPWGAFGKAAKPITPAQVAKLLKPFGVIPGTIRDGAKTFKGYQREQFKDAFDRILDNREPDAPSSRAVFAEKE